ncbi:glucose-1-phosphate adenylyltransferase [bacterium]|nr:glucose-1-phosphate adenylyltransferase [bacterium]
MILSDVVAIILGGGQGKRLYPLTRDRAKPAVPLAGKYRLIDIPISNCINSGVTQIYVLTQFLSASLHRHVLDTYKFDVFSRGFVEILPAEQTLTGSDWYQGTADAVRQQLAEINSVTSTNVVILAGDHLYRMNYSKFVDFHIEKDAEITLATIPVFQKDTHRFGIMQVDDTDRVTEYYEKPGKKEIDEKFVGSSKSEKTFTASMGIYVFKTSILKEILQKMEGTDFGLHIIPSCINKHRVFAYPFSGYWEDIGTMQTFFKANIGLTKENPAFDFYQRNYPIYTRSRFLPPSRVQGCHIKSSLLAEGSRLRGAEISDSIIGLRGVVRDGSLLDRVVMMGADYYEIEADFRKNELRGRPHLGIGRNCRIETAIIDKNTRIGNDVVILSHEGSDDMTCDKYVVRDGIVVIPKNTLIPDGTHLVP